MNTQQRVQNRIQQIRHAINEIQTTPGGFVRCVLIDFSTDTLESKQATFDIRNNNRDAYLDELRRREIAFEYVLRYFDAIDNKIRDPDNNLSGGFTYDRAVQFVKYYLRDTDFQSVVLIYTDDDDVADVFIEHLEALEEAAVKESKVPAANFRY